PSPLGAVPKTPTPEPACEPNTPIPEPPVPALIPRTPAEVLPGVVDATLPSTPTAKASVEAVSPCTPAAVPDVAVGAPTPPVTAGLAPNPPAPIPACKPRTP